MSAKPKPDPARLLLDYLSDTVDGEDVIFRRVRNPDLYAGDLDKAHVIEVRKHESETAETALLRDATENGTEVFVAALRSPVSQGGEPPVKEET